MTRHHSPWPLFGDDLNLARSWLLPQLEGLVSLPTGHIAVSLGMGDVLLDSLRKGSSQASAKAISQWRFRVARLHGEPNPYRHLIPKWFSEQILTAVARCKHEGLPLHVQLNGGIGDHLEALSLLVPLAEEQKLFLNLEMSTDRQLQMEPLLSQWNQIQFNKPAERGQTSVPLKVMALRGAVMGSSNPTCYKSFLLKEDLNQTNSQHWLCCWRAAGSGDRLSAHSRSVPFSLVTDFYRKIKHLHPQSCIVDITKWRDWEDRQLRGMGVEILDPRQESLLDLAQRCRVNRVVTIDTALAHLSAAVGKPADLLLSAFPDERWQELQRPEHHYGQLIRPWRSSQFGSWRTALASLESSLAEEG